MQENFDKYIGIQWGFNESNSKQCDCTGLARLIYSDHGWKQTWDDSKPVEKDWFEKTPLRMMLYLRRNFIPTKNRNELKYGDIILWKVQGEHHLGIYEKYGQFVSILPPTHREYGGFSFRARLNQYESAVVNYYRR